jgi:hypothetical protein
MKQERVILSFIMVLIGLLVAGSIFYFYQFSKKTPSTHQTPIIINPTPTPAKVSTLLLKITNPVDESVVNNKSLSVTGKTDPKATVLVITSSDQKVLKPDSQGKFNTSITLNTDQNLITVISVLPNGESKIAKLTVTYSTSNF